MSDDQSSRRYHYGNDIAEVRPADGVEGILCYSNAGSYFLRVADQSAPDGFRDYDFCHSDLKVRIIDSDCALYSLEGSSDGLILDHAPETLGLKEAT
jgi:hypothetical protein